MIATELTEYPECPYGDCYAESKWVDVIENGEEVEWQCHVCKRTYVIKKHVLWETQAQEEETK